MGFARSFILVLFRMFSLNEMRLIYFLPLKCKYETCSTYGRGFGNNDSWKRVWHWGEFAMDLKESRIRAPHI